MADTALASGVEVVVADLLGSWLIVEIDGVIVVEGTAPTVDFAADGRVFGSASVNRFHGS